MQFARAKALGAYKTNSIGDIAAVSVTALLLDFHAITTTLTSNQGAEETLHIQREMSLHLEYCAEFGLSQEDVEEQEEHQGNQSSLLILWGTIIGPSNHL